jgi:hypothetical protein
MGENYEFQVFVGLCPHEHLKFNNGVFTIYRVKYSWDVE